MGLAERLTALRYPDLLATYREEDLWDLVDGSAERLNLAHECVDRHPPGRTALRIHGADGDAREHTFGELGDWSARFAGVLAEDGVGRGDRVALALEPSLAFYGALFGILRRGAVAVPLYHLFGPEGLRLRLDDCRPRLLLADRAPGDLAERYPELRVLTLGRELDARLRSTRAPDPEPTAAGDLAVLQYTSGTTRELPAAVAHRHRAAVTLMMAALFGVGLRPGDRYFCPSPPAWGHGLWHGTIAPLALGIAVGTTAGRFDPARALDAIAGGRATTVAAAATVYRMLRRSGHAPRPGTSVEKLSFTGEPMDAATRVWVASAFGTAPCSMYGTTEVGVIIVDYPGVRGYTPRPGALGSVAPGREVAVLDARGEPAPAGEIGDLALRRRDGWFLVKDRGARDADGYFHHAGRSDDAIISAGWTMSCRELEDVLHLHPDVHEAAVVGVPDELRGLVAKAFVIAERSGPAFERELQEFVKERLSQHEYPRLVECVESLPRTPAGKADRRALRARTP